MGKNKTETNEVKIKPLNRGKIAVALILGLIIIVAVVTYDAYHVYVLADAVL